MNKKSFLAGYASIRPIPDYTKIIPFLRLNRAVAHYYCLIAGFTWIMSVLHNGTALPLPLYIIILGLVLIAGSQMIRYSQCIEKKNEN